MLVETDETLVVRHKYNGDRELVQTQLFGGIESYSKKSFEVPLVDPDTNINQR